MNARKTSLVVCSLVAVLLALASSSVWAAGPTPVDILKAKINQLSPNIVALKEGGSDLAQGTLSGSASIKVQYELNAMEFPSTLTTFGTFNLGLEIVAGTSGGGGPTVYPLNVSMSQPGADTGEVVLSPSPAIYSNIVGVGALGTSVVTVKINCPACTNADGEEISGNLQFGVGPDNQKLDNNVKVQVSIKLVHPTACVKLYNFLTSQDLIYPANSTEVVYVKKGPNAGKVNATTPYGQLSDNVLVVNTCGGDEMFDVRIDLDGTFETNPNDNPGNAVFTWLASQIVEPGTFGIDQFGGETPQGQALCLANVTLPSDSSFLATVHMGIKRGINSSLLPIGNFSFTASLYPAGSYCSGAPDDSATTLLPYTLK